MIRAILFDFDGLILETETPIFRSWQELYQEYGKTLDQEAWGQIIGTAEDFFDPLTALESELGRRLDRETILPRRRARELDLVHAERILPGVEDYLASARRLGLQTAVASSSSRRWVEGNLERLGLLGAFDAIKTSDDVRFTKPDPELFLAALAALGRSPEEAIVLEDSANGVLAAHRAGIYCVAVPNELTRRLNLDLADLRLESLAGLPLEDLLHRVEQERG